MAVLCVCAAVVAGLFWWKSRPQYDVASQLSRLPAESGAVFYIDVAHLRRSGVLHVFDVNRAAEEADYRAFVNATGFDWRQDLDSALVTQRDLERFFLVTGRFDWQKISAYTRNGLGGGCQNSLCWTPGTQPDTIISVLPIRSTLLSLAVGNSKFGASELEKNHNAVKIEPPPDPVWLYLPRESLQSTAGGPAPVAAFLSALRDAESAMLSLGGTVADFEIHLDARCPSEAAARATVERLTESTAALRSLLAKAGQAPSETDLSGVLTAGTFTVAGVRAQGRWPVSRAFLEAMVR